jgi:hypothetical protein
LIGSGKAPSGAASRGVPTWVLLALLGLGLVMALIVVVAVVLARGSTARQAVSPFPPLGAPPAAPPTGDQAAGGPPGGPPAGGPPGWPPAGGPPSSSPPPPDTW